MYHNRHHLQTVQYNATAWIPPGDAMDLKALRTFILVAQTGSLSKSSDRLRLAQPALSRQIKMLESEMGVRLFDRSPRGMQLTGSGKEFFERISGLIRQIDQSVIDVRSSASKISGQVTLGIVGTLSRLLSAQLFQRVAAELPEVSLRVVAAPSYRLMEWLQFGEIDIGLFYGPRNTSHIRTRKLLSEELFLIGPPDSPLRPEVPIQFSELAKFNLILTSRARGIRAIVENGAAKAKVTLKIRFEADSFLVLKHLVANGLGYTVLPKSALSSGDVTFTTAPLIGPNLKRQLILALPSDRSDTRATSAVVELVVAETAHLIRSGKWETLPAR